MTASEALAQLASDYWEGILRRDPTIATFFGDFRYNDRLPDAGPEGRAAQESAFQDVLRRLEGIPEGELQRDERVSRDMPRLAAEQGLAALPFRLDEMAVDQMGGPQVWLPELLNWHPIDTPEHMDQLVDHDRLQMAAPARVPVSPPSEGGGWTGQEILAHLDQLEQALGDR